ncbi:MAG: diguanylate cyclase [Actinobacteria bacterium]|nr:diguanylate cyclase [Actinomycetota bacterium]
MIIQFSIYVIPYLAILAIILPYLVIIFRLKSSEDLKITALLLIGTVVWILGFALEIINVTLAGKVIFNNLGYLGSLAISVIIFILSAKLAGFTRLVKKDVVIAISILPAADFVYHIVNDISGLVQKNLTVRPDGILIATSGKSYEIAGWVWIGYNSILILLSLIFLFMILAGRHKFFRRQALILLLSVIAVFTIDLLHSLKLLPVITNPAPFVLCLAWIIYWTAGKRYLIMGEVVPINYESIIENINDSVVVLNKKDEVNFMNRPAQDLFSANPDFMGKQISSFWPGYSLDIAEGQPEAKKDIMINTGGQDKYFDVSLTPVRIRQKEIAGKLLVMKDITERKEYEDKIKYMSFHDYLTGLYNRAFFEEELTRLNAGRNLPLSIVMGDVNGLKMINDTYGHEKGDELLKKVAEILKQSFRKSDIISRWGGDEFIILLPLTGYSKAEEIAGRVKKACSGHDTEDMPISISLGIATRLKEDESIEEILKAAEDKMYTDKMSDEKRTHRSIISSIEKSLDEKKYETEGHVKRMEGLALMLGKNLKLSKTELDELTMLSALHDIGKIAVADSIILKPGKLTPEEWEMVKKHPEVGYRIAKSSVDLAAIADAILYHHENWDGSGYPEGIKGTEIPLMARIISIVDSFNAMTSDRPYRRAFSRERAIKEIKKDAGIKFDPELVEAFLNIANSK